MVLDVTPASVCELGMTASVTVCPSRSFVAEDTVYPSQVSGVPSYTFSADPELTEISIGVTLSVPRSSKNA